MMLLTFRLEESLRRRCMATQFELGKIKRGLPKRQYILTLVKLWREAGRKSHILNYQLKN